MTNEAATGVMLRGIDAVREREVTEIEKYLVAGTLDLTEQEIIIGKELAGTFYLNLGDKVAIISPNKAKTFNFKEGCSGIIKV